MSETQDFQSSINDGLATTVNCAENTLIPLQHNEEETNINSVIASVPVKIEDRNENVDEENENDDVTSSNDFPSNSSENKVTNSILDNEKSANVKTNETNDETKIAKKDEVIEESTSGECRNILPILIQHLRSALDLGITNSDAHMVEAPYNSKNIPNQSSNHLFSQNMNGHSSESTSTQLQITDQNFYQDFLLEDIRAALTCLQEILHRIDIDTLNKYSSSLNPKDKLYLLHLISNLVTNLKMVKFENVTHPVTSINKKKPLQKRNRHTIGVTHDELARARKLLEERRSSFVDDSVISSLCTSLGTEPHSIIPLKQEHQIFTSSSSSIENSSEQTFDNIRACNKHMKDVINQQQSLNNRHREIESNSNPTINVYESMKKITDISNSVKYNEKNEKINHSITTSEPLIKSGNKFTAKKSKIKRANTIDIPSFIKLQSENDKKKLTSSGLRRPIDIGDRLSWNPPEISNMSIPSFEPKTENDRKFLALINRNNETYNSTLSNIAPFTNFNYRQKNTGADENWKNRFFNIKTTFDKLSPPSSITSHETSPKYFYHNYQSLNKNNLKERDKLFKNDTILSLKQFPSTPMSLLQREYSNPLEKFPTFTHAPNSLFQKPQTYTKHFINSNKPISSSYLPACAPRGMLKEKLKIFDHREHIDNSGILKTKQKFSNTNNINQTASTVNDSQQNHQGNHDSSIKCFINNFATPNPIFHNNLHMINKNKMNVQCCENVTVQTTKCPNEKNEYKTNIGSPDNDLSTISQDTHANQQISNSIPISIPPSLSSVNSETLQNSHRSPDKILMRTSSKSQAAFLHPTIANDMKFDNFHKPRYECDTIHDNNNDTITTSDKYITEDNMFMVDKNIQNQDINESGIITRYTSAIGTVEESPTVLSPTASTTCANQKSITNYEDYNLPEYIKRHNILQQNIRRHQQIKADSLALNEIEQISLMHPTEQLEMHHNSLQTSQSQYINANSEPCDSLIGINNTQKKIDLFEQKSITNSDDIERMKIMNHPRVDEVLLKTDSSPLPAPLLRVYPTLPSPPSPPSLPSKYKIAPGDSSDEYLVSYASQPHRSIVLSKSESWHQIAASKNHLKVPQQILYQSNKSPCKQLFENISCISRNLDLESLDKRKKIEEKVQQYFHNNYNKPKTPKKEYYIEQGRPKSLSPRKDLGTIARSQTMPHIHDELTDIDKQFNKIFEETTHNSRGKK